MGETERKNFYTVDIEQFEGPLELLLSLIKKNKISIYDIPVHEISEQYAARLEEMDKRGIDTAGWYLPLLAELGLIKSKTLLPEPAEESEEEADPRAELARRLVIYEKFRDAAMRMTQMTMLGRDVFTRGVGYAEEFGDPELETQESPSGMWTLINALCEMRARINSADAQEVVFTIDPVSIERRLEQIRQTVKERGVIDDFKTLFDERPSRGDIVVSFIAILELARKQVVELFQKKPFSAIKLLYSEEKTDGEQPDKKSD